MWERRGRASEATWQGTTLLQVSARVQEWKVELPKRAREFLDAGLVRQQRAQRRSRQLLIGGGSALAAVAIGATFAAFAFQAKQQEAVRQQAQIRLAAADLGRFELVLTPFERTEDGLGTRPASGEVPLEWSLRAPDLTDLHSPGRPLNGDELRRSGARWAGGALHEQVEARSGPAFLEVKRAGCATVMIGLERLPGYTERAEPPKPLELPVPSCAASTAGMIEIAAGPFFRNVDRPGRQDDTQDEAGELDGFALDRTEVTRGAFAVYQGISTLTGDAAAPAPNLGFEDPGKENLPIVGVNFRTARDYCRFMGKDLPSLDQWQKALRGGLTVNGAPNPNPKRELPWLGDKPHAANLRGDEDGALLLAPVGTFPSDVSPYGVMDLAGNVTEWTLGTPDASSRMRRLRIVGGANWDTAPELSFLQKVTFRSTHPDPFIDYALGFRCARPLP
ncbi:MAG: SUMF1/EgtB/PvdO family nonheme iron enzyme [Myxococcaceae bacterium]